MLGFHVKKIALENFASKLENKFKDENTKVLQSLS